MTGKFGQKKRDESKSLIISSLVTGFIGGIFWGTIGLFAYFFRFTDIRPNVILAPWHFGEWNVRWIGTILSIVFLGMFGTVASFVYYLTLKKFDNIWAGIVYGIVLFLFVFYVLNPLFPTFNPMKELTKNTIITTLCLFVLFGVFIGYSISYDYQEMLREKGRHKDGKEKE